MSEQGGRPTKYTDDMPQLLYDYLQTGCSVTEFAAAVGVAKSTVYKCAEQYEEFSDALIRAREASQAYWENKLKSMMTDPKVNAPLVKLYFANRFNWNDKQSVDNTSSDGSMTPPQRIEIVPAGFDEQDPDSTS